jgi:hypothetical protein
LLDQAVFSNIILLCSIFVDLSFFESAALIAANKQFLCQ